MGENYSIEAFQTLKPVEDKIGLIRNPAMGWVLYSELLDEKMPPAKWYWDSLKKAHEKASIFYLRMPWSKLEPREGQFAWKNDRDFQDLIQGSLNRGLKLAFCVFVNSMHCPQQATPDWVIRAGAKGYMERCQDNGLEFWNPYLYDPIFQHKLENFVYAFAKEYDDPERVNYLDAQGLGWWGEMHHMRLKTDEQQREIIRWISNVYKSNFKKILLGHLFQNTPEAYSVNDEILGSDGFMIRRDALGSPVWLKQQEKDNIKLFWPRVPFYGENCYHHIISRENWWRGDGYQSIGEVLAAVLDDARELHANTLDLRVLEDARTWTEKYPQLVQYFIVNGGYRLVPTSVSIPKSIALGKPFEIKHTWKNTAFGKIPNNLPNWNYKYKVAFALLDKETGKAVIHQTIDSAEPSDWLKGKDYTYQRAHFNLKRNA